VQSILSMLRVH